MQPFSLADLASIFLILDLSLIACVAKRGIGDADIPAETTVILPSFPSFVFSSIK